MNQSNAIEVRNITKKFKIYHDKGNMLKERALHWSRNKYEERWVLKGVSFDVKKGEAIGLIGHNGCGKSTTLKMLTKIMYPDSGEIEMCGRVSSLLELGAGFHPDLSGRENIYINASIFGLSKKEIDNKIAEIIEFSELEEYIDNPVRTYSSGMYMKLAFSVAINVNADILLIDEILAVGDVNFQKKCFERLLEIKEAGTTIVLVSHSMGQIESICDRCIWLDDGLIRAEGRAKDVDEQYLNYMNSLRNISEKKGKLEKNIPEGYLDNGKKYDAVFNAAFYYNMNADVAQAYGKDEEALLYHFLSKGMDEGRQGSAEFNVHVYRQNYLELQQEFGDTLRLYYMHFIEKGKAEGRIANKYILKRDDYSAVFNADFYRQRYKDVEELCGTDENKIKEHFLYIGMKQGRQASEEFNVYIYLSNYKDLFDTFGMDYEQYYVHYINVGKTEEREARKLIFLG